MISHDDIWRGIDRLASSFGYSPSGLAKKAGLDPTSFNKSKRVSPDGKPRWPSTESLSKILAVTGATMADFISLTGADPGDSPAPRSTLPVIGFAQAGSRGYFDEDGYPAGDGWDEVEFPQKQARAQQNYALRVSGDSMQPLYRDGDLLIIAPGAPVKRGDRVVVKTTGGEVMAKQLAKQNEAAVELLSLNPRFENRRIVRGDVVWMARILWVSQ